MKKWETIYEYLFNLILKDKDIKYLPSENSLKIKFRVSVQPVRKAFYKLVEDKMVKPIQGKGYLILELEDNVLFSFTNLFPNAKSNYKYLGKIELTQDLREKTRFYYEDFVHLVEVRRYFKDNLHIYQLSYLSDSLFGKKMNIDFIDSYGLMKFFNKVVGNNIGYSVKKIITITDKKIIENLDAFKTEENLILDKGMLFTKNQQLIEYRDSYYKLENFEWTFIEYFK